jgi:hypothetical protein
MKLKTWFVAIVALAGSVGAGGCQLEGNALASGIGEVYAAENWAAEEEDMANRASSSTLADGTPIYRVPQTKIDAVKVLDLYQLGRLRRLGASGSTRVFTNIAWQPIVNTSAHPRYVHITGTRGAGGNTEAFLFTQVAGGIAIADFYAGGAPAPVDVMYLDPAAAGNVTRDTREFILLPNEFLWAFYSGGACVLIVTVVDLEIGIEGQ